MSDHDGDDSSSAMIEMDHSGIHYVYQQDLEDQDSQDGHDQEQEIPQHSQQYQILAAASEINSESSDLPSVRAILVDGQYYLTDGDQTLLFQDANDGSDPLNQYYFDEHSEYAQAVDETSLATEDDSSTQFVQLIEDSNEDSNQHQIIYYTDTSLDVDDSSSQSPLPKRIKLEGQMVDLEAFLQQQQEQGDGNVHYAVMEDGSIHKITNVEDGIGTKVEQEEEEDEEEVETAEEIDLSRITGTNLITGQKVTLHSYMEKLQKNQKKTPELPVPPLVSIKRRSEDIKRKQENSLLNKKISIGKTRSGKKIVGKIVKVEKKPEEDLYPLPLTEDEEDDDEEAEDEEEEEEEETKQEEEPMMTIKTKVVVKKSPVTKETFEEISKTLGGVMEMESVRKKLEEKNIVVKLVEKKYVAETDSFTKSCSYSYGYMEKDYETNGEEKWRFVPDQDTQDAILEQIDHLQDDRDAETNKTTKYGMTTSLTILISHAKGGNKTIRVNLSPAPGNLCTICAKYFKSNSELKTHMKRVHFKPNIFKCQVCDVVSADMDSFDAHKAMHVQEGHLFACSKCDKCFTTKARLENHLPTHDHIDNKPALECSVCSQRCASESVLKRHLLTHLKHMKPYGCDVCGKSFLSVYDVNFHRKIHFPERTFVCSVCLRTFSRHSNLLRHMEIHKGDGALYKCEVCYCSYNFASSLTRHIVQNHINVGDFRKKPNEEVEEGATTS